MILTRVTPADIWRARELLLSFVVVVFLPFLSALTPFRSVLVCLCSFVPLAVLIGMAYSVIPLSSLASLRLSQSALTPLSRAGGQHSDWIIAHHLR